jgi:Rha family phage regulatory protein
MNQLVFVKEGQAVTDSLIVAEVFRKEHKNVLKDIRELGCSDEFRQLNFEQSSYVNSQNKEMPMYYMSKKGFTLLAMGYTGKEAMKFKEAYIEKFEEMEQKLKQPKILSEREQLIASMKLSLETSEELDQVKNKMNYLEEKVNDQITLSHGEQISLQHSVKKRVEKLWDEGIKGTLVSKNQMYSKIYSQLKRAFQAPSYRVVKRKDFHEAMAWVSAWRPM